MKQKSTICTQHIIQDFDVNFCISCAFDNQMNAISSVCIEKYSPSRIRMQVCKTKTKSSCNSFLRTFCDNHLFAISINCSHLYCWVFRMRKQYIALEIIIIVCWKVRCTICDTVWCWKKTILFNSVGQLWAPEATSKRGPISFFISSMERPTDGYANTEISLKFNYFWKKLCRNRVAHFRRSQAAWVRRSPWVKSTFEKYQSA